MVRCASYVRSRWMTDVQGSTKLLVGGMNTIISSVTQSDSWNAFSVRRATDVVCWARSWSGTVGFVFMFAVLICVTHPRIRDAKSALLTIELRGRTGHGAIGFVRSIGTVALSIAVSAHRDARSVVGATEFVFGAIG
jgi:Trk-type K+ transport system membrane component